MKIAFKALLILALSILTSCDLFTTRESESPNQSRSNYQPPFEKEIVIQNLQNALSDKNSENYMACFVDSLFSKKSFSYSASSEAASTYQIFLQGWGLNEEQQYVRNFFNKVPKDLPVSLTFDGEIYSNLSGDSLIYSATYFIKVPSSDVETQSDNYSGNIQLNMLRDNRAYWVIYYWKDTKSQTLPSWSELKGNFY